MKKKVITLQNGSNLNEKQFIKYFESKVLYTIRKFRLFHSLKGKCNINFSIQELFSQEKIGDIKISRECLDDISVLILQAMIEQSGKKKLKELLPLTYRPKKLIRPFYLMSREEMILYSKLKHLRYNDGLPETQQRAKITTNNIKTEFYKLNNNLQIKQSAKFLKNKKNENCQRTKKLTNDMHLNIQTSQISLFLDELEKKQRNVKNSIVSSLLKIENLV